MKRIHLIEFEDLPWFPEFLRNYMTDFLHHLTNVSKLFRPSIPVLEKLIRDSNQDRIIDLGSGSGGGMLWIGSELKKRIPQLRITFTDLYPNEKALEYTTAHAAYLDYLTEPIDARCLSADRKGLRTQFLSLHHFKKKEAVRILENAVRSNQPIAIFEGQERSLPSILAMLFSPISVLVMTPFIRPFSAGRIFFTYVLPLVPIFVLWDGVVSSLRTYSVKEMNELIRAVEGKEEFIWQTGRLKSGPGVNLFLTGRPKNTN